ncbi:hypothetical protein A0H76_1827 [Hepatospora eriocheir]|uniref:Uncharacterized protein n=1 Tax=Hepatospora eriocheir TaxID=1081669 RepID=A0A1X0QKD4_9MICR|nr:hypothetical protein HERIO_1621 [Hepatospora eriocheir]ORE00251.1 hypothetical protein A0H76_1827 [Hepatospora eriocheir]
MVLTDVNSSPKQRATLWDFILFFFIFGVILGCIKLYEILKSKIKKIIQRRKGYITENEDEVSNLKVIDDIKINECDQ